MSLPQLPSPLKAGPSAGQTPGIPTTIEIALLGPNYREDEGDRRGAKKDENRATAGWSKTPIKRRPAGATRSTSPFTVPQCSSPSPSSLPGVGSQSQNLFISSKDTHREFLKGVREEISRLEALERRLSSTFSLSASWPSSPSSSDNQQDREQPETKDELLNSFSSKLVAVKGSLRALQEENESRGRSENERPTLRDEEPQRLRQAGLEKLLLSCLGDLHSLLSAMKIDLRERQRRELERRIELLRVEIGAIPTILRGIVRGRADNGIERPLTAQKDRASRPIQALESNTKARVEELQARVEDLTLKLGQREKERRALEEENKTLHRELNKLSEKLQKKALEQLHAQKTQLELELHSPSVRRIAKFSSTLGGPFSLSSLWKEDNPEPGKEKGLRYQKLSPTSSLRYHSLFISTLRLYLRAHPLVPKESFVPSLQSEGDAKEDMNLFQERICSFSLPSTFLPTSDELPKANRSGLHPRRPGTATKGRGGVELQLQPLQMTLEGRSIGGSG